MKKYLITLFIVAATLIPLVAWGGSTALIGSGVSAAGGCNGVTKESQTTHTTNANLIFRSASNQDAAGGEFTASATYNLCSVTVRFGERAGGTPSPNSFHAEIWSDDGGSPSIPNAQIGGDSDSLTFTDVTTEELTDNDSHNHTFTWSSDFPSISDTTVYWIVLMPEWTTTATEYCALGVTSGDNLNAWYDDGVGWSASSGLWYHVIKD